MNPIGAVWRRLPLRHQIRLGRWLAAALLRGVNSGLSRLGYRVVSRLLLRLSPAPVDGRVDLQRARAIASIINQTAESPPLNMNCLRRSLALWFLLRWVRLPSDIRIGINLDSGHAWVEHGGRVINDSPDVVSRYAVLLTQELSPETMSKLP